MSFSHESVRTGRVGPSSLEPEWSNTIGHWIRCLGEESRLLHMTSLAHQYAEVQQTPTLCVVLAFYPTQGNYQTKSFGVQNKEQEHEHRLAPRTSTYRHCIQRPFYGLPGCRITWYHPTQYIYGSLSTLPSILYFVHQTQPYGALCQSVQAPQLRVHPIIHSAPSYKNNQRFLPDQSASGSAFLFHFAQTTARRRTLLARSDQKRAQHVPRSL